MLRMFWLSSRQPSWRREYFRSVRRQRFRWPRVRRLPAAPTRVEHQPLNPPAGVASNRIFRPAVSRQASPRVAPVRANDLPNPYQAGVDWELPEGRSGDTTASVVDAPDAPSVTDDAASLERVGRPAPDLTRTSTRSSNSIRQASC